MDKFEKFDDILKLELSEEVAGKLTEALVAWKEDYAARIEETNNEVLEAKIQELEEMNEMWREGIAEEYSDKLIDALDEMRGEVKANVLAEYVETDPTYQVMEEIKRLVAPSINEEYIGNVYGEELVTLRGQVKSFQIEKELAEGARVKAELLESYSEKLRPLLSTLIGEGTAEEVENKFFEIIESISEDETPEDDEDFEDFDFDDEDEEDEDDAFEDIDWNEFSSIDEEFEDSGDKDAGGKKKSPAKSAILDLLN